MPRKYRVKAVHLHDIVLSHAYGRTVRSCGNAHGLTTRDVEAVTCKTCKRTMQYRTAYEHQVTEQEIRNTYGIN